MSFLRWTVKHLPSLSTFVMFVPDFYGDVEVRAFSSPPSLSNKFCCFVAILVRSLHPSLKIAPYGCEPGHLPRRCGC